jgi:predicted N-formylglutamate amidohydrolase
MNETPDTLLAADDPPAFTVGSENGRSPFLIAADHAGRQIPRRLGALGLADSDRDRHIAWDIGAGAVADMIAAALDAFVIRQNYSRLVIDCNRTPATATSILGVSELTSVPGNVELSKAQKSARRREIFEPYHNRIALELDRRQKAGHATALISVHTFTPVFKNVARRWHVGVLYNRDARFAHSLLELLRREEALIVGDNEPYSVSDESDYTIPVHGEKRALHHVALEIRQDLVTEHEGQRKWAALLARLLPQAYKRLNDEKLPMQNRGL